MESLGEYDDETDWAVDYWEEFVDKINPKEEGEIENIRKLGDALLKEINKRDPSSKRMGERERAAALYLIVARNGVPGAFDKDKEESLANSGSTTLSSPVPCYQAVPRKHDQERRSGRTQDINRSGGKNGRFEA
jgi:hypothetical protein